MVTYSKALVLELRIGCDPELFIAKDELIVGSENLELAYDSRLVHDGVQLEIHPGYSSCRELLACNMIECMQSLQHVLRNTEFSAVIATHVTLSPPEMQKLSAAARRLLCKPSYNLYGHMAIIPTTDTSERSASGHLHFSTVGNHGNALVTNCVSEMVSMLDLLLGNQMTLLDRAPGSAKRRELYGKAGEYRLPSWGLEYRTLSNFWLRGYPLASLTWAVARLAINLVLCRNTDGWSDVYTALVKAVPPERVEQAINNNDFELAWANWICIKPILEKIHYKNPDGLLGTIEGFEYLVKRGIDRYFVRDPIQHWAKLPDPTTFHVGWEGFVSDILNEDARGRFPEHKGLLSACDAFFGPRDEEDEECGEDSDW